MGDATGIEWTDHTFNPWWGCVRVSPACEHCYAETFAARFGVAWGVKADRKPASEKVWAGPVRWNKAAEAAGVRARVFCASMADGGGGGRGNTAGAAKGGGGGGGSGGVSRDPGGPGLTYAAVVWHCRECAGSGTPLFVCEHPHRGRLSALSCARSWLAGARSKAPPERCSMCSDDGKACAWCGASGVS